VTFPLTTCLLDNGLTVTAARDELASGAAINLWYRVGSADETAGASGFAHLFEHLMFAGSAHVADGQHMVILEALGGLTNATTSFDRTNYFETVPLGALPLALWLEADRLASLRVSPRTLATQRAVVHEEKRQRYDNQPYGDQLELLLELGFPAGHPYCKPTIGVMSELDTASLDDVRAFHRAWYRPGGASLVVVSPLADEEVFRLADKYFGGVPAGDSAQGAQREFAPLPALEGVPRRSVTRPVPRSVLHLMWLLPPLRHPDHPAVSAALDVLAAGQACRLQRSLVRDAGLAQSVGATDFGLTRGTSLGGISAQPTPEAGMGSLENAMLEHLAELIANGPTEPEMRRVAAQTERDSFAELADPGDRADAINEAVVVWGDADHVNHQLDPWMALTPGDVARAAATWLAPEKRAVLEYLAEEA